MNAYKKNLCRPAKKITTCKEIALFYNQEIANLFNALTPQERVFIYYFYRAALPGNDITADQLHRHSRPLIELFEYLHTHRKTIRSLKNSSFHPEQFINEVQSYLTYLWTNYSPYFIREHADEKRTPKRLELQTLTQENLLYALNAVGYPSPEQTIIELAPSLFEEVETTLVVPGSIEKSAVNMYAPNFKEEHFQQLSFIDQERLNGYCYLDDTEGPRCMPYKIGGKFSKELSASAYWLEKAYEHVQQYPQQFDAYFVLSLRHLIDYLHSGEQDDFKKHCIAWARTHSRIDYCFGFIENYMDPKSYRGMFQAEATIKTVDMQKLKNILPELEAILPFPKQFQRADMSTVPNASINTKAFANGELGPLNITLAYCLPNDEELRSEYGSKQIIYDKQKSVGELVNPSAQRTLFNSTAYCAWADQHDPDNLLAHEIQTMHTILHETVGHASGRLAMHTFVEDDLLMVDGCTHKPGESIPVNNGNLKQFLEGYEQALEELRAEINALTIAVLGYDQIAAAGLLGDWPRKIEKTKMVELFIRDMARSGIMRLITQPDNATEIAGDHARANTTILNYLLDHGGIEYTQETVEHDGNQYTVLDIAVVDQEKTIAAIKELAIKVQTIKSTADRIGVQQLMSSYGTVVRHPEFISILKKNREAVAGNIKVTGSLCPLYRPITNGKGVVVDARGVWPTDIAEQYEQFRKIMYEQ